VAKTKLREFFSFMKKFPKNEIFKKKVIETIKLSKTLIAIL
jgi:hypothetical protein